MYRINLIFFFLVIFIITPVVSYAQNLELFSKYITEIALNNNYDESYPLPLISHWNTGEYKDGFSPDIQLQLIKEGHYLLPWFFIPPPGEKINIKGYWSTLREISKLKMPITLVSTQWERLLSEGDYLDLPTLENPNVITNDNKILKKVSPFSPVKYWKEVGQKWTDNLMLKKMQNYYPDPPLVMFLSNNEHKKLLWHELEDSKRFNSLTKIIETEEEKKTIVGNAWNQRYKALHNGMRESLTKKKWKSNSIFVGYNAFGSSALGRWYGWSKYTLNIKNRFEPWPLSWDGASVPYYLHDWDRTTDFHVWSPQIAAMNWVFMLKEARKINPDFLFELSIWDGRTNTSTDKGKYYNSIGQKLTPERYAGFAKFGMWLLRPKIVRPFRSHLKKYKNFKRYFLEISDSIKAIHQNENLKRFWKKGKLLSNMKHKHPYNQSLPSEYLNKDRWFMLDTSLDPKRPWTYDTEIYAYSLALVIGEKPNREWLIYAYSPINSRDNVTVNIPEKGKVKINFSQKGAYYLLNERTDKIIQLEDTE